MSHLNLPSGWPPPLPDTSPTDVTGRKVLVCLTCNAVVAEGPEIDPRNQPAPLDTPTATAGLRKHFQATGHRTARMEDRATYIGQ